MRGNQNTRKHAEGWQQHGELMELKERAKRLTKLIWDSSIGERKIEQILTDGLKGQHTDGQREALHQVRGVVEREKTQCPWAASSFDRVLKEIDERTKALD